MNVNFSETDRIKTVKGYEILDTPADGSFDKITALASKIFNVPGDFGSRSKIENLLYKNAGATDD